MEFWQLSAKEYQENKHERIIKRRKEEKEQLKMERQERKERSARIQKIIDYQNSKLLEKHKQRNKFKNNKR